MEGKEHHRPIGFLPPEELIASLMLGIAKCHFDQSKFHEAIIMFDRLLKEYPRSDATPEAIYLRGVSEYQSTHSAEPLKKAYERLKSEFPSSEWVKRAKSYSLL
jgi:outer membrane protein assembly factor BamD (BamD/ComL family)